MSHNQMTELSLKILTDDKKYAQEICNDAANTREHFVNEYTDQILDVAKKYNYAEVWNESWADVTKSRGGAITNYDKIMETYLWLFKSLFNKSCSYKGDNGARFSSYIIGILRDKKIFIDWLRSKKPNIQGVTKPPITGYIPKCIEKLGKDYEEIFKLLQYGTSPVEIPYKLDISEPEARSKYEEIVSVLARAGKLLLIQKPTFEFVDDDQNNVQLKVSTNPESQSIVNKFLFEIVPVIVKDLTRTEYRMLNLYWDGSGFDINELQARLSAKKIYELFSRDEFKHYLIEMGITSSSDIHNRVTKTAKKCKEIAINKFPDKQKLITNIDMRNVLKIYFQYFNKKKEKNL